LRKNEWCQQNNHKKIIYTPILILFGGNDHVLLENSHMITWQNTSGEKYKRVCASEIKPTT
jgi:hypothetical protein